MTTVKSVVFCWLLCCLAAGCTDKDVLSAGDIRQETIDRVSLRLTFTMTANSTDGTPTAGETPGTGVENELENLYVFTETSSGTRVFYPYSSGKFKLDENNAETSKTVTLDLPAKIQIGEEMTFYVGANLNEEQAKAFCKNEIYQLPWQEIYHYNIIEAFAPGIKTEENSPRTNIAMFCTKGQKGEISPSTEGQPYPEIDLSFELERLVAKVLVTCKEGDTGYAPLKEGSSLATNGGWIRLDNVYFLINSLNKSSYIMKKVEGETTADGNMNLSDYIDKENGGYNGDKVAEDFVYAAPDKLYERIEYFKPAPKYDASKLPGSAAPYTPDQALYCPENLFSNVTNEDDKKTLEDYGYVWPMITHVTIAAKYTPKKLYIEKDLIDYVLDKIAENEIEDKEGLKKTLEDWKQKPNGNEEVIDVDCPNEYTSRTLLTESLKKARYYEEGIYSPGKGFPQHTYFYYNNQKDDEMEDKYYTYGAVILMLGESYNDSRPEDLGNYLPYTQGWGYYYTYINGTGENPDNTTTPYSTGQVKRNTYYILTINSFSHPGTSINEGGFIDVNTRIEEWRNGGTGEVTLD